MAQPVLGSKSKSLSGSKSRPDSGFDPDFFEHSPEMRVQIRLSMQHNPFQSYMRFPWAGHGAP
jgi:hypothetical protein